MPSIWQFAKAWFDTPSLENAKTRRRIPELLMSRLLMNCWLRFLPIYQPPDGRLQFIGYLERDKKLFVVPNACCVRLERGAAGYIGEGTIRAAIEIARYLIPHTEIVLSMMQAKEASGDEDARYVLRWIERHGRRDFTKRDAQQHGKRRFPKVDALDPALAELTRRGYVRLRPSDWSRQWQRPKPKQSR